MAQNRIDWTFGFNIDKNGLSEINKQLDAIKTKANDRSLMGALNGDELKKVTKDAEKLKEILNQSWNPKLNQLDLSKVNNELKKADLSAENLRKTFSKIGPTGVAAFNQFSSTILNTNMQIKQSSKLLDDMATTFKNTVRYGISSSVFNNLSNSIQKAYNYTKALDTSLNDIRIVTGYSADEMEKFAVSANRVAKDLGRSTKDFTEASLIYYQQGLGAEEAQARAEVTLKAANVTGQTGREVSEQLTAVWNGYKVTSEEAELYVDKLAAVAAATAADLEELSTGMSKVASAANLMGVDVDQLNAQLATIVSVTRQAPESVGVALKTIYARMSDIKSGLDDETTLGNYTEKMAQYGINVLDANGNLRDMGKVIEEIGGKWDSLSREQQIALSQVMAGTRQYNNLLSLFDNWDQYEQALETSANAAGTLQKQQDIYMESTEAHLQKLRTEAERTYDVLFDQDSVNSFADTLTNMLSVFNNFLEGIGGGTNAIVFFGTTLANIFNKQVAASIERQIENIEVLKANASAAELKASNLVYSELGTSIRAQQEAAGNSITSVGLQEEVKIAKEILSVKELLTEEEYNELTAIQHQVGLDADRLKYLQYYKKTAEDYFQDFGNSKGTWNEALKMEKAEYDVLLQERDLRENYLRSLERGDQLNEKELWIASQLVQKLADQTNSKEKQTMITEAANKIVGESELNQQEILTILDIQNEKLQESAVNVEVLKNGTKGLKDIKEEEYNLEQKINLETQAINAQIDPKKRQQIIANGVQGLTSLITLAISLSGVIKTINDDSLTATEKFERVLPVLLTAVPQLLASLSTLKYIIPLVGMSFKALGDSISLATAKMATFEIVTAPVLVALAAIAAIIVAVGVAVHEYDKEQNAANKALEISQKKAKDAAAALQETKTAYENLKSSIENYKKTKDSLEILTKGTIEWKEQIIELNNVVLDLLEKYPQLQAYLKQNQNGLMTIEEEGFDEIIKQQQRRVQYKQSYQAQTKIEEKQNQIKVDTQELRKIFSNANFKTLSDDQLRTIAKVVGENQDKLKTASSSQELVNLLKENGIDVSKYSEIATSRNRLIEEIENQNDKLVDFNNNIDKYTKEIGTYTDIIASSYGSSSEKYVASKNKVFVDEDLKNLRDQAYQDYLNKGLKEEVSTFDDFEKLYKKYIDPTANIYHEKNTIGFYAGADEKSAKEAGLVDIDSMVKQIADIKARDKVEQQLDSIVEKWDQKINNLNKMMGADSLNNSKLGDFIRNIKEGKDLREEYTEEELKKLRSDWEKFKATNSIKDFEENFGTGTASITDTTLEEGINKYYKRKDYSSYLKKAQKSLDEAGKQDEIASVLSYGSASELDKNQIAYLEELEQKYTELGEIQDKTSHEYLTKLREIKEQEEDNANTALQTSKKIQEKQLDMLMNELDELLKDPEATTVEISAKTDEIEKILTSLEETNHEIEVKIKADLASDVDDAFGLAHELDQLRDTVTEDLTYTYEEAQDLIGKGYGEMFTNAEKTADGVIKVNKKIRDNFIDDKQDELEAERQAKITQLEQQKVLLNAQKQALVHKLDALQAAAGAENEIDAAAAMEKAQLAEQEYNDATEKLNAELQSKSEGATQEGKIDEDLYNQLTKMAEGNSTNEQKAESDATTHQAQEVAKRISNVRQLYSAYQSLARQIKASENGEVLNANISSGGLQSGGATLTSAKDKIFASPVVATFVQSKDLSLQTKELYRAGHGEKSVYQNTIKALISDTKKRINSIEAQIGDADAGIAALQSVDLSLDTKQRSTGKDKKKSGSGKKGNKGNKGSSKDPNSIDPIENEEDRYHQVDVQLKLIENDLQKLDNAKEKAFGADRIKILNKELEKYDKQIDTTGEKIDIAVDEAAELRAVLASQGVKFGADGAISNYMSAIQAQENAVNKVINKYNSMSAAAQENYKNTVEQEKKNFEEFKKNIDRYDELVSNFIPDLEKNIQDAIDKQVDIQIEEFDMEIEIRLNLKDAQQDWNEFRKEVLEDFDKDNPIGNLFKDYEDLKTLLAEDNNGLAQSLGRQLENTLDELYKMDSGKSSDVYGADRVKALEDLKKYLDESIAALEEIEDLEDAIHEDFIKNMDAIQDRFDKQIDDYETISKLLEHDKEVIELVSGDNAYKQLSRFYDEQDKNYKQQLAFQNQQVTFWREQLNAIDKSSDEWAEAKQKWQDAVDEYNDLIESSIENLQDKYLNAIKDIFNDLNNRLSGGRGLEGMNDQWQLLNMQSEEYLDNVNGIYKTQELANKYLDAIDNTSNIKAQQRLRDIMDDELDNLRARDQLSEYDLERAELRYQIAVKQIALEEAQQNKNRMRLRRDTQGNYRYEYVADDEQLAKSKQEISDFYNQLYNLDAQKYSENLEKVYNLTKDAEDKIQELYEDTTLTNEERQERILETTQYYAELIDQLAADNEYIKQNLQESTMSELFDLYDVNKDNYEDMTQQQQDILNNYLKNSEDLTNAAYDNLFNVYNENIENFKNMTDAEIDNLMNELIPGWDSAYQQMINSLNAEGGFIPATEGAYEQASVAAENYYNEVIELANQSNEANQQAIDTIDKMREADEAVLEVARQEMEEGTKYLDYLSELTEARKADAEAAKAQTKAAYEYWQEQQRQAAEAAKKEADKKKEEAAKKAENSKTASTSKTPTKSSSSSSKSSGGGDGKLNVGDKATYTGKYYYDSRGTAPAGSKYSGVKNGIIVDRINNNAYGIHIKSADGKYNDLGWIKKSQLSGYDTGGYTGTWGKDGRLALLHQKELVLNSTDTQNMLDAVKVIRQITDSLGSNILSRLADINSAGMGNLITNNDALNQNVHIEANFPNARNHNEIEEALNNLVNAAAHRINKK